MELIQRQTSLSANVIFFCRYLRKEGFNIGPAEEKDALLALEVLSFSSPMEFRLALKAALTRSRQQQLKFNELFDQYWKEVLKAIDSKVKLDDPKTKTKPKAKNTAPSIDALKSWLYGNQTDEEKEIAVYSAGATLAHKDFSTFGEEEVHEVIQLIHAIARNLANKRSRRLKATNLGKLDLRRTMRKNLRRGGELIELAYQQPQKDKMKLVILCDVSKSMDLYARFLVQFLYAFQTAYRQIETFVFSTSLHRVTAQLRRRDFKDALEELRDTVPQWSSGTQIGQSLATFVKDYRKKLLDKKTITLIMSDGWDTGDLDVLASNMATIQQHSSKVIWLNPLAGNPDYEPTVKGMATAMPYIDIFASVHNVDSLRQLAKHLT